MTADPRSDSLPDPLFDLVLVANRGEIAVRVMRTLRRLGIGAAAVYSDADREAVHVHDADVAMRLGPAPASESYLRIDALIDAALQVGADAVHPGYGFLSEQPAFARACAAAGLVFVGPPPDAIATMGDKITAKQTVAAAGVSVVPGRAEPGLTDLDLADAAAEVGYPVLVKPSAGGGGKGMRLVRAPADLAAALVSARREAAAAFGDETLFVERFVDRPRHVEIQVLLDAHGGAVHLGERECSLQRRHQKIVEEAPSPLLTDDQRAAMGAQALAAARACGYQNAGTVEFIVSGDRPDEAYFMEMNTRLQVEHPVTEMVWDVDLVEQQLRVAAGLPLGFVQADLAPHGHAVEVRLYAEDPATGFLPSPGHIVGLSLPDPGVGGPAATVRVDAGVVEGSTVSSHYDPMIAKVIAHSGDRAGALDALDRALATTRIAGVESNVGFLRRLLADPDVRTGDLDTELVERRLDQLTTADAHPDDDVVIAAALAAAAARRADGRDPGDPWSTTEGWRLGEPAWAAWRAIVRGRDVEVRLRGSGSLRVASLDGAEALPVDATLVDGRLSARVDGRVIRAAVDPRPDVDDLPVAHGSTVWLTRDGVTWAFVEHGLTAGEHRSVAESSGTVASPMPGVVVAVAVAVGDSVVHDQPVAVVEAMKMEHTLRAPFDGRVEAVHVAPGARVPLGAPLVEIDPAPVDPAPVDPAPVEPAPVKPALLEPRTEDPT